MTKRDAAQQAKADASHAHASDMFDVNHRSIRSFQSAPDYGQMMHEVTHEIVNELGGR
jgi:hypothetical protein